MPCAVHVTSSAVVVWGGVPRPSADRVDDTFPAVGSSESQLREMQVRGHVGEVHWSLRGRGGEPFVVCQQGCPASGVVVGQHSTQRRQQASSLGFRFVSPDEVLVGLVWEEEAFLEFGGCYFCGRGGSVGSRVYSWWQSPVQLL